MAFSPSASAVKAALPVPLPSSSVAARHKAPALISMRAAVVNDMSLAIDEYQGILSGVWPENFSLLRYIDLCAYLES
jgi:hypothetical protein